MLVRGIKLFLAGYVLSFFRSLLPFLILGPVDEWSHVDAFFIVDIFQLAGLSFMLLAFLKKLQVPSIVILLISIQMVALNQFIMLPEAIAWDSEILTGIVNLFVPVGEWSCFPFLTWFSFPALGYVFGDMVLIRCRNKNRLYGIMLPVGLAGVIYVYYQFYILYPEYTTYYYGNNFYYMGVINVLLTALFIAFAISFWHFAGRILLPAVKTFLSFLSRNLTTLYVISWVIISILIHIQAMYNLEFGTLATVALFVIVLALCAVLTKLYIIIKHHKTTVQKMQ